MPNKNDLSSLKVQSKNLLAEAQKELNSKQIYAAWRKPKPINKKQFEILGLRFTKSEFTEIKKKAGLLSVAPFLKNIFETETGLLKKCYLKRKF